MPDAEQETIRQTYVGTFSPVYVDQAKYQILYGAVTISELLSLTW